MRKSSPWRILPLALLLAAGCASWKKAEPPPSGFTAPVRVSIYGGRCDGPLTFSADHAFSLKPELGEQVLFRGQANRPYQLTVEKQAFLVDGQRLRVVGLRGELEGGEGTWSLGTYLSANAISFRRLTGQKLQVVCHLPVEEYLAGVISVEMPINLSPPAALETAAIVARSFLAHKLELRRGPYFDVVDSQHDQAFKGTGNLSPKALEAVKRTEGVILFWNGRALPAFYHSTCGGHTAAVEKVFEAEPFAPLAGVSCGSCESSPKYRWTTRISAEQLKNAWEKASHRPLKIKGQIVRWQAEPDELGRAVDFTAETAAGENLRLNANRVRLALLNATPKILPSAWFTRLERQGDEFVVEGRGYGHGVGLCQWGAITLAQENQDAESILQKYYPGARLVRAVVPGTEPPPQSGVLPRSGL